MAQIWISTAKCFGVFVCCNLSYAKKSFRYNVTSVGGTSYKETKVTERARVTAELSYPKKDKAKIITDRKKEPGTSGSKTKV